MDEAKILTMLEEDIPLPDDGDSFDDDQMGLLWDALHEAAPKIAKAFQQQITDEMMFADLRMLKASQQIDSALTEYRFRQQTGENTKAAWQETSRIMAELVKKAQTELSRALEGRGDGRED